MVTSRQIRENPPKKALPACPAVAAHRCSKSATAPYRRAKVPPNRAKTAAARASNPAAAAKPKQALPRVARALVAAKRAAKPATAQRNAANPALTDLEEWAPPTQQRTSKPALFQKQCGSLRLNRRAAEAAEIRKRG